MMLSPTIPSNATGPLHLRICLLGVLLILHHSAPTLKILETNFIPPDVLCLQRTPRKLKALLGKQTNKLHT